jgi:hypothetical protein
MSINMTSHPLCLSRRSCITIDSLSCFTIPDHEVDDQEPEEPVLRYLYLVLTYAVAIVFNVMERYNGM